MPVIFSAASPVAPPEDRNTSLFDAASDGNYPRIANLLAEGADVNADIDKTSQFHVPEDAGDTPLIYAINGGHYRAAEMLLKHGALVNFANKRGDTPLLIAATNGQSGLVHLLLANGADMTAVSKAGSPFSKSGPANRDMPGDTPLIRAARNGTTKTIEFLLTSGADVHAVDQEGKTPLMIVKARGLLDDAALFQEAEQGHLPKGNYWVGPVSLPAIFGVKTNNTLPLGMRLDKVLPSSLESAKKPTFDRLVRCFESRGYVITWLLEQYGANGKVQRFDFVAEPDFSPGITTPTSGFDLTIIERPNGSGSMCFSE
ncbi:MAG: ankyrin repeat domain-containing protein [Janthinobacterium lividum]